MSQSISLQSVFLYFNHATFIYSRNKLFNHKSKFLKTSGFTKDQGSLTDSQFKQFQSSKLVRSNHLCGIMLLVFKAAIKI